VDDEDLSPTRRRILELRSQKPPVSVRAIALELGITTQAVYQHLTLHEAYLARKRSKRGRRRAAV
jgi:predicted ArsR family transcriptional regulator